jgi:serine/threonine protein kinase
MSSFKSALGQFLIGEIEIAALEAALAEELRTRPDAASQINTQLEQLYRSGRLPNQVFAVLKRQVLAGPRPEGGAAGAADAASGGEERTRFRVSDQQQKPADAERTVFQSPTGSTGGDTGRSQRSQSSQSRSQPTAGSRSGSSQSSNWSNPSEWTGGGAGSDDAAPPDVGSIISGRFVLEQRIGLGGMGIVYKARDLRQEEAQDRNPYVALKLLNEEFKRNPESLKALQREARKAQDLSHQNVVYVSSFDRDGGNVYMVMELLDGDPLDRLIKRHADKGLPFDKVLPIVEGLVAGLGHAHKRGIVHSDFKPSNAWITREGIVKIFDFGIARAAKVQGGDGEKTLFDPGTLGALTPAYASVEMLGGEEPDIRDDVYALACVTYELLAGAHPFKKRPADEAKKQGVKPAKIKGLSNRQFKGLLRGLAFDRKDRSPSVEEFLESIRPRKIQKSLVAAAAMGVIVLAVTVGYVLPRYLDQREIDELSEVVSAGDPTQIKERLGDIAALDVNQKRTLFNEDRVTAKFIEFYNAQIRSSLNPDDSRFEYREAARLIVEAKETSGLTTDTRIRDLETNTFNLLNTELTRAIDAGVLIPEQGPRNAVEIDEAMHIVQPERAALPLAPDLLRNAREVADRGDTDLAAKLVDRGLKIAPEDASLANLRDELRAQSETLQRQAQLARAETSLSDALPTLDRPEAFEAVRASMTDLANLDPHNTTLQTAQTKLAAQLDDDLQTLVAAQKFDAAQALLGQYDGLLAAEAEASMQQKVASGNAAYQSRLTGLVANVRAAVDAGRLGASVANGAEAALAALIAANAPDNAVVEARGTIANAYLLQATNARDAGQWEKARLLVQQGQQQQPGAGLQRQLNDELAAIDSNEQIAQTQGEAKRQQLARQERERDIASLKSNFEATLKKDKFTIADANSLKDILQNLQAKGGDVAGGSGRIVERLVAQADTLKTTDTYDAAIEFLKLSLALFPTTPALQTNMQRLVQERDAQFARSRDQQIKDSSTQLASLLAKPDFEDPKWDAQVRQEQQKLEKVLGKDDVRAVQSRDRIAAAYLQQAKVQRGQKHLANAETVLATAQAYAPSLPGLTDERLLLEQDKTAQRAGDEQRQLQAKITRLKQSVRAKAGAKDAGGAVEVFSQLSSLLSASDPYLQKEGPETIADAYVALADDAGKGGRSDAAQQLIDKALKMVPGYQPALSLRQQIERQPRSSPPIATTPKAPVPVPPTPTPSEPIPAPPIPAPAPTTIATASDPCAQAGLVGNGSNDRASCRDPLGNQRNGPTMVVIPAGGPLGKPLAVGKFEITVRDYNAYCELSKVCAALAVSDDTIPVTGISIQEAEQFAAWLSAQTHGLYRLPTTAEWEWAANAQGGAQKGDLNCLVGSPSNPSKGARLRGVKTGDPNGWGLYNSVGNAREWAKDGSSLQALGGARTDHMNACSPNLTVSHSGEADEVTGFRLVREIGG